MNLTILLLHNQLLQSPIHFLDKFELNLPRDIIILTLDLVKRDKHFPDIIFERVSLEDQFPNLLAYQQIIDSDNLTQRDLIESFFDYS